MYYKKLPQQPMKGRGWSLCCPHFEFKWLNYSLYIFQSMLSGGVPGDTGVRSVEYKLYDHAHLPHPSEIDLVWRCCRPPLSSRASVSTLQDYQFFLEGSHASFLASYGTFNLKEKSDRQCI